MDRNGVKIVVAPRLVDSRRLVAVATSGAEVARRIRITSTARLHDFVACHSAEEIERLAVDDLCTGHPELSAGVRPLPRLRTLACAILIALASIAIPGAAMMAGEIFLSIVFLAWAGLRLFGLLSGGLLRRTPQTFSDEGLPTYSIVVALYREAMAVPGLVAALREFHYPLEKLDIKFVLEPDDHETREAIDRLQLGPPFEVHIAPNRGPAPSLKLSTPCCRSFAAISLPCSTPRTGRSRTNSALPWRHSLPTASSSLAYKPALPSTTLRIPG
jgi:hypothetical protein